jgi:hypothetical protein
MVEERTYTKAELEKITSVQSEIDVLSGLMERLGGNMSKTEYDLLRKYQYGLGMQYQTLVSGGTQSDEGKYPGS